MTAHTWISRNGDFDAATSWSSADPPTVGKSTLTFAAVAADGETVTIDSKVYTFKNPLVDAADNVFTGATATDSRDNLRKAINDEGVEGTNYGTGTAIHSTVKAEDNSTDKLDAIGKTGGTADAGLGTTETLANGSWDFATLQRVARWAAADKALFTGDSVQAVLTNHAATNGATPTLDQSLVDIALFLIGEGYAQDIGTSSVPLIINADRVVHLGKGTLHYDNSGIGAPPDTTDEIIIAHTGAAEAQAAVLTGGKLTTIAVARGKVKINDTDATTLLVTSHVGNRRNDAKVEVIKTSAAITNVRMAGGWLRLGGAADGTNFDITDATLINESSALAAAILRLYSGTVRWNSGVTLTRAELYSGLLDFTQTAEEKAITTLLKFPAARFAFLPDLTTVTTDVDMDGLTGTEG
jgi:hypothetical protein